MEGREIGKEIVVLHGMKGERDDGRHVKIEVVGYQSPQYILK